jgi:tripartite-type tricarboxylate transporter receptor subunit TctC
MTVQRRTVLKGLGAGALALSLPGQAVAQIGGAPLKFVFPFGAGGAGDALTRTIADKIGLSLGRTTIVENKTGADGRIGIQSVKSATADGDTVLLTTGPTMWLYPMVHAAPGYDPYADFAPISRLARIEFCVAVANNTNLKTMAELAAWVKANPDKAVYGVPGAGTIPHFTGDRLSKALGVDMRRVPYRGNAPAITDLVGGQVPIVIGTLADALQQHRAGTVKMLAVVSKERSPFVPDVPTLKELGYDVVGDAWYGLWTPANTPADRIAKLNAATVAALGMADVREKLQSFGLVSAPSTPEELAANMKSDAAIWGDVIKASGFRMAN